MCRIHVICHLTLVLLAFKACTATLSPVGDVYMCVGQPQTFLCSISNQGPAARLEWRVEFKNSRFVPSVIQTYTLPASDEDQYFIRDGRDGVSFVFNLTSNSSSLESAMTVVVADDNGTTLINNATVYCGQESDQMAVIHVRKAPLSEMNLTDELISIYVTNTSGRLSKIIWNRVENADHYSIDISPSVQSESTIITTNTSIILPLLYNEDYTISVVASNCAGNSTPEVIHITVGCCLMPLIDSLVVVEENNIILLCAIEGSHITYHCQPGMVPSETKMSICMGDGTWSPNPRDLMCNPIERNNSSHLPSSDTGVLIPVLTVSLLVFSVITFFAGCVLGILCIKCFSKTLLAKKNKNNSTSATTTSTTPVYEEVLPEITTQVNRDPDKFVQNKAYEPIQINNH